MNLKEFFGYYHKKFHVITFTGRLYIINIILMRN